AGRPPMNSDRIRLPSNSRTKMPDARANPAKIGSPGRRLRLASGVAVSATACCTRLDILLHRFGVAAEVTTRRRCDHIVPGTPLAAAAWKVAMLGATNLPAALRIITVVR